MPISKSVQTKMIFNKLPSFLTHFSPLLFMRQQIPKTLRESLNIALTNKETSLSMLDTFRHPTHVICDRCDPHRLCFHKNPWEPFFVIRGKTQD